LTTAEKAKKAEVEKEIAAWERARYVLWVFMYLLMR
jgi:hypothetical protein